MFPPWSLKDDTKRLHICPPTGNQAVGRVSAATWAYFNLATLHASDPVSVDSPLQRQGLAIDSCQELLT